MAKILKLFLRSLLEELAQGARGTRPWVPFVVYLSIVALVLLWAGVLGVPLSGSILIDAMGQ